MTRPPSLARQEAWRQAATQVVGEIPTYVLTNKVDLKARASFDEVDDLRAVAGE